MLLGRVDARAAAPLLAVLLLLSLALHPRLRRPGVPAEPEPAPEVREGEPAGHGPGAPPEARVSGTVAGSQPTRETAATPFDRRR